MRFVFTLALNWQICTADSLYVLADINILKVTKKIKLHKVIKKAEHLVIKML